MPQTDYSPEPSTSGSLLQRARDGDADSWRRLAQIYGPIVYSWARRCGCQSADAADVMQETFAAVSAAIGRFDYERPDASFRGWLWTITRNKVRDQARRDDGHGVGGTEAQVRLGSIADQVADQIAMLENADPPSDLASDVASAQLRACEMIRHTVEPRSWRMFWETAVQGREPAAVAEEMDVSKWAVYKAKARVLQRLQRQLAGLES
ncbi:RNA polymerase sigma factor [Planctomycetes bacterium K23_9]|uniref:RNA polymerase sigma factor CnrH n=1 Tax=Stieleria marina TaxID=1930275 RepID=A0A517NTB2_9BACT|nr:RNA polymerase sigma factor CnrH [Planctomycetes bacterium K23_9]